MEKKERLTIYKEMLRFAEKTMWYSKRGLCYLVSVATNGMVMITDLPELMAQRPPSHEMHIGVYWWNKYDIWKRRRILRYVIKSIEYELKND